MNTPDPSPGAHALASHVERPVGTTGYRRVRLCASTATGETIEFEVVHYWRLEADVCASFFLVLPPGRMALTAVLLRERALDPWPALHLRLSTARRTRTLEQWRIEDRVLGTDFTYDDLRLFTPRPLTSWTEARASGDGTTEVDARWLYRGRVPVRSTTVVDANGLVASIDVVDEGDASTFRRFHALDPVTVDGVAMPGRMRVERPAQGYASWMDLVDAAVGLPVPGAMFSSQSLAEAAAAALDLSPR